MDILAEYGIFCLHTTPAEPATGSFFQVHDCQQQNSGHMHIFCAVTAVLYSFVN